MTSLVSPGETNEGKRGGDGVRAVSRSLSILMCLGRSESSVSLDQISEDLSLARSTTYRLIDTLCDAGFVERGPNARHYRLGLRAGLLASAVLRRRGPDAIIHETLASLEEELGETVGLSIRDVDHAVIIDKVKSRHDLAYDPNVGSRLPCSCTAAGKALLVDVSEDALVDLLTPLVKRYTAHSRTSVPALVSEILEARERGFATDDQEWVLGLRCISVPLRNISGEVTHALSVAAAAARVSLSSLHSLAPHLKGAALQVEPLLSVEGSTGLTEVTLAHHGSDK